MGIIDVVPSKRRGHYRCKATLVTYDSAIYSGKAYESWTLSEEFNSKLEALSYAKRQATYAVEGGLAHRVDVLDRGSYVKTYMKVKVRLPPRSVRGS